MRTPLTTQLLLKTSEGDALVGKGDNVRKVGDEVGGEASPFDGCLHLASWLPLANNLLTQFLHIDWLVAPLASFQFPDLDFQFSGITCTSTSLH